MKNKGKNTAEILKINDENIEKKENVIKRKGNESDRNDLKPGKNNIKLKEGKKGNKGNKINKTNKDNKKDNYSNNKQKITVDKSKNKSTYKSPMNLSLEKSTETGKNAAKSSFIFDLN